MLIIIIIIPTMWTRETLTHWTLNLLDPRRPGLQTSWSFNLWETNRHTIGTNGPVVPRSRHHLFRDSDRQFIPEQLSNLI